MNCNEAAALVARYVDGELDDLQRRTVEQHLRTCANCVAEHQAALALRDRVRADVPYYEAPPALRERVRALTAESAATAPGRAQSWRERWRWVAGGALAGCAATIVAWTVGTAVVAWHTNEDVAAEAVAMHVRATLNNHLIQVASSDQHTVKPWLSSKLDYSPPVPELSGAGFPLAGGRLDYLDNRPVAALVYRYRQHVINLFVWPDTKSGRVPPQSLAKQGYNVRRWSDAGMTFWAISDVNAAELKTFAEAYASAR